MQFGNAAGILVQQATEEAITDGITIGAAQRAGDGGQRFSGSDAFEDAGPAALVGDLLFDEPLYRLGGHLVALPRPEIAGAAAAREIMPPLLVPRPALPKLREHQRSEERRVGKEGRSRWSPYH